MDRDKQIEEMAQDICRERTCPTKHNGGECNKKTCKAQVYAERAFDAGYRKQVEGEWIGNRFTDPVNCQKKCTMCGEWAYDYDGNYCPNCGVKMKGADDEQRED